ncbi:MAG: ribose-phosphate pyrophosphokinase [Chloroflexi bacterium]|nr:ribose-phosphate pyrophosphokinase [Chloroflexota bacterium]
MEAAYQEMRIFSGNAHPELAKAICDYLETGYGACEVFEFSNENVFVRVQENVRNRDVYIVQPFVSPVNTSIMELLIMIDALKRASAGRVTAVVPYYAYGRSDKKDQPRVPITARLLANMIETAGADRVLTVDLHAGQIQGFFNIPLDELTALFMISRYFREKNLDDLVVVATDVGASKRARNVAQSLNAPLAIIEKRRGANDDKTQVVNVIGEVEGKRALLVDEEINTGGTILNAAEALKTRDVTDVFVACTHPVFSGDAVEKFQAAGFGEVVVTDTVPLPPEKRWPQLTVLSIAPLIGEAISRIHTGRSIGELFQMDKEEDGSDPKVPNAMVGAKRG